MPENSKFIEPSSNSVTLHLPTWKDGSCRMSHFVVEQKKKYTIDKQMHFFLNKKAPYFKFKKKNKFQTFYILILFSYSSNQIGIALNGIKFQIMLNRVVIL